MKILVLGATGGIGRAFCGLARDHQLIALARSPEKVPAGVKAIAGDPLNLQTVAAIQADAAVFALGPRPGENAPLLEPGLRALLGAAIPRLAIVSAAMLYPGVITAIVRLALRHHVTDLRAMEALARASNKDWTLVRPPRLLDTPGKGRYRIAPNKLFATSMSRADVARALLDILEQHQFSRQTVAVGAV